MKAAEKMTQALEEAATELSRRSDARRAATLPGETIVVGGEKVRLDQPIPEDITAEEVEKFYPRYVVEGGNVRDNDDRDASGLPRKVSLRDTITLDNRVLKIGDFGQDAYGIVRELYEQFLSAHQQSQVAEYSLEGGSSQIPDFLTDEHCRKMLVEETDFKRAIRVGKVNWGDPHVTFEQWMHWSAATIRWRIQVDFKRRFDNEIDIRRRETMTGARDLMESCLIAIEKFLALPERKRLTAV